MDSKKKVDMVIGVDFGMTQTGVAYSTAPWTNIKIFQSWGDLVGEVSNKVPSRISYSSQTGSVRDWGFGCNFDDPDVDFHEYFKLYIDPDYQDDFNGVSNEDALCYYQDYMTKIHDHIAEYFNLRTPNWTSQSVEWVFSVPTTWKSPALVERIENLLRRARFGEDGYEHSLRVTLTEAEAAAICVAADHMKRHNVLAVCDAGGGTTDVNILKLASSKGNPTELLPLLQVEGKAVGSALIDIRVQQYIEECLLHIEKNLPAPAADVAERMMLGRFERFKCTFGTEASNLPELLLEIPGMPPNIDLPYIGVRDSKISISQRFLKELFDEQVDSMIQLLVQQFNNLQRTVPNEQVTYLVLSGGLGSSKYVRDRLVSYFRNGDGALLENTRGMQLLLAENPQLAVTQGLVADRAQQLSQRVVPISQRFARVNYGVVVNERYDPSIHVGIEPVIDPRDRKKWAMNQIQWLIREGDKINDQGVSKHVRAKLSRAQLAHPWRAQFVMFDGSRNVLPRDLTNDSVRTLCVVQADLENVERKVKNRHWWQFGKFHEIVQFDLKVIPGSTDLKFQLWNKGKPVSGNNDSIRVDWGAPVPSIGDLRQSSTKTRRTNFVRFA